MADARPNIILITLHDLGRQLRIYDADLPANPNIERIAERGVVFRQHYATCPLCSPSRASIITGRYPHSNGMNGLTHRGFALNPDEKPLAEYFNEAGYHTALYGFQHEAEPHEIARLRYTEVWQPEGKPWLAEVAPAVARFLQRRHDRPFMLAVGTAEVHRKFKQSFNVPVAPDAVKVPPYLRDCPDVREDLADFYGLVQVADRGVGIILDALARCGLEENTVLIFTTDHGFAFPRAKSTLYDAGIGVVFLLQWPARLRAGEVRSLTSHVDVLPTLLDIIGRSIEERIQGRSFLRLLEAGNSPAKAVDAWRAEIFAEKSWHGNEYDPMRCVRTARFKYIRNFKVGWLYQTPLDIKRSLSGKIMEQERRRPRPIIELYDLINDPHEQHNLAGAPQWADVERDLATRLERWMRETGDPLPDRDIPWPAPGKEHYLNNMDCPMPDEIE